MIKMQVNNKKALQFILLDLYDFGSDQQQGVASRELSIVPHWPLHARLRNPMVLIFDNCEFLTVYKNAALLAMVQIPWSSVVLVISQMFLHEYSLWHCGLLDADNIVLPIR